MRLIDQRQHNCKSSFQTSLISLVNFNKCKIKFCQKACRQTYLLSVLVQRYCSIHSRSQTTPICMQNAREHMENDYYKFRYILYPQQGVQEGKKHKQITQIDIFLVPCQLYLRKVSNRKFLHASIVKALRFPNAPHSMYRHLVDANGPQYIKGGITWMLEAELRLRLPRLVLLVMRSTTTC